MRSDDLLQAINEVVTTSPYFPVPLLQAILWHDHVLAQALRGGPDGAASSQIPGSGKRMVRSQYATVRCASIGHEAFIERLLPSRDQKTSGPISNRCVLQEPSELAIPVAMRAIPEFFPPCQSKPPGFHQSRTRWEKLTNAPD